MTSKSTILLPPESQGETNDLHPQSMQESLWYEEMYECPIDADHGIVSDGKRLYCTQCGVYWLYSQVAKTNQMQGNN